MSADNWAVCPQCVDRAVAHQTELRAAVTAAYGNVTVEEFDRLRAEAEAVDTRPESSRSFREDYEFWGAETGVVHVGYQGGCSKCGLKTTINEDFPFYPEGATTKPHRSEGDKP